MREWEREAMRDILRPWAIAALIGAALVFGWIVAASAHQDADWIRQQNLHNRVGEWCCGVNDCSAVAPEHVHQTPAGYRIDGPPAETIPYSEPLPFSPDGKLWICRRPDHTRRCVFDRPPGT